MNDRKCRLLSLEWSASNMLAGTAWCSVADTVSNAASTHLQASATLPYLGENLLILLLLLYSATPSASYIIPS